MKRNINRCISVLLAVVFSLSIFVLPNGFSNAVSIVAYAAENTLSAPKLISVKKDYTKLTVSWSEVKGANAYRVYIKKNKNDEYYNVCTTSKTTCIINKNLSAGTIYYVKITPIQLDENKKLKATGKPLLVKTNTKKYNDKLKNIQYTPTKIVWADVMAYGGGVDSGDPATAYFTLSWDDLEGVSYKNYAIYIRSSMWGRNDEIPVDAEFSHKNGRTIATIGYSCGAKISCVIYPLHNGVKGRGTVMNITTYAPRLTSIDLSENGYVRGKSNTYYSYSDSSLFSVGFTVGLILGLYGYDLSYDSSVSSDTKYVYIVKYGSLTVGTVTFSETSYGVAITLKDSGDHIMNVESPDTAYIYL